MIYEQIKDLTPNGPCISGHLIDSGLLKLDFYCPYCKSQNITVTNTIMTCMGGNPDPNHYSREASCRDCNKDFYFYHKLELPNSTNIYYGNKDHLCIKGIPNFAITSWKLPCNCGGELSLEYRRDGKVVFTQVFSYGKRIQGLFIKCNKCNIDRKIED